MRRPVLSLALFAFVVPGCGTQAPDDGGPGGLRLTFARASAGGVCIETKNGGKDFPDGVATLKLVLGGEGYGGFCATVTRDDLGTSGEVLVQHVPPGKGLTLDLAGCDADGKLTWTGRTLGVDVNANDKVAPRLYFTHKGAFSCTGSADSDVPLCQGSSSDPSCLKATLGPERAFHGMAAVQGGRALVVGGFNVYSRATEGEPAAIRVGDSPKGTILEYDPSAGLFRQWAAQLGGPRAMAALVPFDLDDRGQARKVLVVGGIAKATLSSTPFAPIAPSRNEDNAFLSDALPKTSVELIDVEAKTVKEASLGFDAQPLAATASSPDGLSVVVTGGMMASGEPSNLLFRVDAKSASQLASWSDGPLNGQIAYSRMGHTATWFGDGHVLVLGGVFEPETKPTSAKDIVVERIAEVVEPTLVTTQKVAIDEAGVTFGPFAFHDTALLRDEGNLAVFLVAGGVHVYKDKNGPVFDPPSDSLLLLRIDTTDPKAIKGTFSDQAPIIENRVRIARVFHSLTRLPGDLAMIAGGYNSLTTSTSLGTPSADNAACFAGSASKGCYESDVLLLQVAGDATSTTLQVVADTPSLSRGRFGLATLALADGTVLSTGGVMSFTSDKTEFVGNVIGDAELYNPPAAGDEGACAPCP